jgi:hypothetical protein
MELAIQALEHGRSLTAMDATVMQSGAYGAGNMVGAYGGSAGGILDEETTAPATNTGLESGASNSPAAASPIPATTAAPVAAAKKSSALSARQSAALLAAGVAAAVFLL